MRQEENAQARAWSVSIHASVKDATIRYRALLPPKFGFNPRICKRCDWYLDKGPRVF